MEQHLTITVDILDTNPTVRVTTKGRDAWALQELMHAGEVGCTPLDNPGPRWSGYVHNLRKLGFIIETIRENHDGPFPGQHARYVLRSRIRVLDECGDLREVAHG